MDHTCVQGSEAGGEKWVGRRLGHIDALGSAVDVPYALELIRRRGGELVEGMDVTPSRLCRDIEQVGAVPEPSAESLEQESLHLAVGIRFHRREEGC